MVHPSFQKIRILGTGSSVTFSKDKDAQKQVIRQFVQKTGAEPL